MELIKELKAEFTAFSEDIEWHRRRRLLPYDWQDYEQKHYAKVRALIKKLK
jgi:hypothetical protein